MSKYYSLGYETLAIETDGSFTLNHSDSGEGMHDASRREFWVAKGKWTENSTGVYYLNGTYNGSKSGSRTDHENRRIEHYHTDYKDEPFSKTIDVSDGWNVEQTLPDPDFPN